MTEATIFLKPGRLRTPVRRHPWVYRNSVERIEGALEDGDAVIVRAPDGRFVAHAFVNQGSRLFLRLVSFERAAAPDDAFLRARVREAVALRHDVLGLPVRGDAYRVIHSEGDGLPGLIVDRYGDVLVLTCSSLGTFRRLEPILDELEASLAPRAIVEHGVAEGLRKKEGLPAGRGVIRGALDPEEAAAIAAAASESGGSREDAAEAIAGARDDEVTDPGEDDRPAPLPPNEDPAPPRRTVTVDGLRLGVPLFAGQKTALFLDQRENVRRVAELAGGRRVLDACCYAGPFGIAAAMGGAASVHMFDSSADAVALAKQNARLNGVEERVTLRRASLYKELHRLHAASQAFDLVVLDPPKFASAARDVPKARKGYLDANTMALKLLAPGGLLLTCSCSHHISAEMLEEVLREAATRAKISLRVLEHRGAGADHPVDLHTPEGRYLKAILVQRRA